MIPNSVWDISPFFKKKPPRYNLLFCLCGHVNTLVPFYVTVFNRGKDQYRADIHCICTHCNYAPVFGVHISKEDYVKIKDAIGYQKWFSMPSQKEVRWDLTETPPTPPDIECLCGSKEFYFKELHPVTINGQNCISVHLKCKHCHFVPHFIIPVDKKFDDLTYQQVGHVLFKNGKRV